MMKDFRRYLLITTAIVLGSTSYAQYNNSGISAGFLIPVKTTPLTSPTSICHLWLFYSKTPSKTLKFFL